MALMGVDGRVLDAGVTLGPLALPEAVLRLG